jgi:hypothetical protein
MRPDLELCVMGGDVRDTNLAAYLKGSGYDVESLIKDCESKGVIPTAFAPVLKRDAAGLWGWLTPNGEKFANSIPKTKIGVCVIQHGSSLYAMLDK